MQENQTARDAQKETPPAEQPVVQLCVLNRQIEEKFKRGEITWESFDWWLRTMCGV